MLRLIIEGEEFYNEETEEFSTSEEFVVDLEHSLVSLSKWESIFEVPFLGSEKKTTKQTLTYIEMMIVTPDYPNDILKKLKEHHVEKVNNYIGSSQSATTFAAVASKQTSPGSSETITSELIYYWMVVFSIPFECETWHLNRLLSLIKICGLKNSKPKRRSKSEVAAMYRDLNAERKAKLGTTG